MKRFVSFLLIAVMCFMVVGCENSVGTEKQSTETTAEEKDKKEEQPEEEMLEEEKPMDGVFRYANWGDSMEDIEDAETATYMGKHDELLLYNVKLLTYDAEALYVFGDNGFEGGMYTITDSHTEPSEYINDFNDIKKALTEKYGEPYIDAEDWSRDLLKSDPGLALYQGIVKYGAMWKNENVKILLQLKCDNHEFSHVILYKNPNIEETVDTEGL